MRIKVFEIAKINDYAEIVQELQQHILAELPGNTVLNAYLPVLCRFDIVRFHLIGKIIFYGKPMRRKRRAACVGAFDFLAQSLMKFLDSFLILA